MSIHARLAMGITEYFKELWLDKEHGNLTVRIDNSEIRCHRFVLAACSRFFRRPLKSNLRGARMKPVKIKDISFETFNSILTMLYTGEDELFYENMIPIWKGAHQLQMAFLVEHCEKYVMENLCPENFELVYKTAAQFDSHIVLTKMKVFMLKNFEDIRTSDTFLRLSLEDIHEMIRSDDLDVKSEDSVLDSIIQWVEFSPGKSREDETDRPDTKKKITNDTDNDSGCLVNASQDGSQTDETDSEGSVSIVDEETGLKIHSDNRSKYLPTLLKAARPCLASPMCLTAIYQKKLRSNKQQAKDVIFKAMSYHAKGFLHGQWSSLALYRNSSEYANVGVRVDGRGKGTAWIVSNMEPRYLPEYQNVSGIPHLTFFEDAIFVCTLDLDIYSSNTLYKMVSFEWNAVCDLPQRVSFLLSHKNYIYIFTSESGGIYRINPLVQLLIRVYFEPFLDNTKFKHAFNYEGSVVLFCEEQNNGVDETAVYSLDTTAERCTRQDNLKGPADKVISFKDDEDTYVLQTTGDLWLVHQEEDGVIGFVHLTKLWNSPRKLNGAVTLRDKLVIHGDDPNKYRDDPCQTSFGNFSSIHYFGNDDNGSNFIPAVVHRYCLGEDFDT